eukprot:COSAG01_NODE_5435_length_4274_cov_79.781032_2_plen_508_part_00
MAPLAALMLVVASVAASARAKPLGYFLRDINASEMEQALHSQSQWLSESRLVHYRLLPGRFPAGMDYHFDGLAAVMALRFDGGRLRITVRPFHSELYDAYDSCIFFGSGTGPTAGEIPCLTNPLVNLLPIQSQLWLTIDTVMWGRIDPSTLGTLRGAGVRSQHGILPPTITLNAHPACDRSTGQCFVEHPCPTNVDDDPVSNQACISELRPSPGGLDLHLANISRTTLPAERLIQHSHSPCVTPSFVVAKIDSFTPRLDGDRSDAGLLRLLHQKQDDLWVVMDRRTNRSHVIRGNHLSFVNNHFWNCYEEQTGATGEASIVVETVAATSAYLDTYFRDRLNQPTVPWDKMFLPPQRCLISMGSGAPSAAMNVTCTPLLQDRSLLFDYPTFNPLVKMDGPRYRHFYAISPRSRGSRWFDQLIKVEHRSGRVVATFSEPHLFLTEADFVPRKLALEPGQGDDDGWLITVGYNASSDQSSVWLLDARTLGVVDRYLLRRAISTPTGIPDT